MKHWVPGMEGDETLSLLGVSFNAGEVVGRVRIVSGNAALGPDEAGNLDLVAMDDFIYGEPVSTLGLRIAPSTSTLSRRGAFDILIDTTGLAAGLVGGQVTLDGLVVTQPFLACVGQAQGSDGTTFRCPLARSFLSSGDHTLQVQLTLSDGTRVRNAVRWTIVP